MKNQKAALDSLKMEWDSIIQSIIEEPFRIERNQRLVNQYDQLLSKYEEKGIDVSQARQYQRTGSSSDFL